jgi:type IV pilus assembly protein PilO
MATRPNVATSGGTLDRLPPVAKVGVGFLFVVLVGLLYFVIFYGEVDNELTSARELEKTLADQLQKAERSKVEYQKDLDEKTRREQLGREQKKILPDDPETPAFLSALQSVATLSGVNLTSWSPAEEIWQDFYVKVPMKLTLSGKFHQVAKFFHGVGQLDRIINIEDIQLKKPTVTGDDVQIQVECLATAFRSLRQGEQPKRKTAGPNR